MHRYLAASAFAGSAAALAVSPPPSGPLPAEELFRAAPLGEAAISPDGRHLGAIVTDKAGMRDLVIFDLKAHTHTGLRGSGSLEVTTFRWLGDRRLIFSVSKDKIYSWGLYSATLDHLERFTPIDKFDVTQFVGVPRSRPDHALVWVRQSARDDNRPGPLLEIDANRGLSSFDEGWNAMVRSYTMPEGALEGSGGWNALVRSYRPPGDGPVLAWDADRQGELALCATLVGGRVVLHRYERRSDTWAEMAIPPGARPMSLDPDPRYLWVVTHSPRRGYQLRRLDLDGGGLGAPVLTDARYDIGEGKLFFSADGRGLAGVTYTKRERASAWFLDDYAVAQATVDKYMPDTSNELVDHNGAEREFLFISTGPRHPATLELLDLDARTLTGVADEAPWLKGRRLRPVEPIDFTTRDGVELEGYLTLPEGAGARSPAPLVVLCHGGPRMRDTPDFSPEVQFLASRGYAVLQPNYRGSTGYTPEISHSREYDFRRMHDDVTDATRSVIATGVVDPGRIAIMGASFGGYLAVAGVAFEKDLYRCAITECGVFDWALLIKSKSYAGRPGEYEMLKSELGTPGRDGGRLEQISPLDHAGQIHVPVLIAHGTEDAIVDVAQSRRLASELRRRGVPHETFYRSLEGHGFFGYRDRVDFYHRVEAFLAANLGGATLTPVR
jgi:dipeptidyl aminopeptidase/acylaminoacyl peptidase